jgi:hypothetical protein
MIWKSFVLKFVVNRVVRERMPVVERVSGQAPGAIANRLTVADARRISANLTSKVIASPAEEDKVCWVEMKQYPYQLDHQVELLHLQAEADALLMKLQAHSAKQLKDRSAVQQAAAR